MNSFKRINIKNINVVLVIGLILAALWFNTPLSSARPSSTAQATEACFTVTNKRLSRKPDEGWLLDVSLRAKEWQEVEISDFRAELDMQEKDSFIKTKIMPQDIQYKQPLAMHLYFDIEGSAFGPLDDKEDENNRLFWQSMFGESSPPWLTTTTFPIEKIRSYCNCTCDTASNSRAPFAEKSGSITIPVVVRNHAVEAFTCSHKEPGTAIGISSPIKKPEYKASDTNLWIIFRWQSADMEWLSKEATDKDIKTWVRKIKDRYPMITNQHEYQRVVVFILSRAAPPDWLPRFKDKIEETPGLYADYLRIEELKEHDLHRIEQYITTPQIELPILLPRALDEAQMKTAEVKITHPTCERPVTINLDKIEILQSENAQSFYIMFAKYIIILANFSFLLTLIILFFALYCYKKNWFEFRSKVENIVNPSPPNQS